MMLMMFLTSAEAPHMIGWGPGGQNPTPPRSNHVHVRVRVLVSGAIGAKTAAAAECKGRKRQRAFSNKIASIHSVFVAE